ncbi:hypothetical protein HMPREF1127_1437 [Fusobacterium necrophorum subsp. funduliforme Fnf 1007]|uniref:Uncharacterized protein n=1 Tax=Fusobacterium necrophorum subsp. funduliforme Fnf 1007 TaxID=1161424 RepID=A0AAN4ASL4_9FUSO|nr:hypothetical protein HMPREF1127_1437 [Fusobacterium necrophorum subsp. funduliforme Fnf 1007]
MLSIRTTLRDSSSLLCQETEVFPIYYFGRKKKAGLFRIRLLLSYAFGKTIL